MSTDQNGKQQAETKQTPARLTSNLFSVCNAPAWSKDGSVTLAVSINGLQTEQSNTATFPYTTVKLVSMEPKEGPLSGGTKIVVKGSGFVNSSQLQCYFE